MTFEDLQDEAVRHLAQVGAKRQIMEAIDGLIEAACDGLMVRLGHGCSCDPQLTHDYAWECLRQGLDVIFPEVAQ